MGKRKKQIALEHAQKKQQKKEEATALDGTHALLIWLKIILALSVGGNIYAYVHDGITGMEPWDIAVNVVFLILLVASVYFHSYKKGVYLFFAYGILELLYQFAVSFIAWKNGVFDGAVGNRLFEYTFFSALIMIPMYLYYRKKMYLLK